MCYQTFNLTTIIKNDENKDEIEQLIPFVKDYNYVNDMSTYYLCKGRACLAPINDIEELRKLLST
jgi:uncharacterized protein YyaL (SSP411 family)